MKKISALSVLLIAASLLTAVPASAGSVTIDTQGRVTISDHERTVLRNYYQQEQSDHGKAKDKKLNKGMEKRLASGKGLPPGWQKKMSRGDVVPSDIWRYHEPLPSSIIRRLPPQPEGVVTVRIDNQVVRVIEATHVLLDAFDLY
ncbi:hypothetical protein E4T66_06475 [Sinimarinibacterium sp. CAU 1509]|uniref:hypothetical protein n=1 Tax=Sinimarinibacterium sp. CAU 1509 TaxID=2562283 RepID=UPI0010ABCBC7|nr:hypothetical protein [Sinimarinibacterium sp. CAU 1509]TJY61891.1 hypothetical protein E4T66_06475 [Sinimarinibacterium sp. CAU 1509]